MTGKDCRGCIYLLRGWGRACGYKQVEALLGDRYYRAISEIRECRHKRVRDERGRFGSMERLGS